MTIKAIRMFDDGFSQPRTAGAPLYMGDRVSGYRNALKAAGIDPARVMKLA